MYVCTCTSSWSTVHSFKVSAMITCPSFDSALSLETPDLVHLHRDTPFFLSSKNFLTHHPVVSPVRSTSFVLVPPSSPTAHRSFVVTSHQSHPPSTSLVLHNPPRLMSSQTHHRFLRSYRGLIPPVRDPGSVASSTPVRSSMFLVSKVYS